MDKPAISKKKLGRPSIFSEPIFDLICAQIAEGKTLSEICREPGMPSRFTFYEWIKNDEKLSQRFAHAREIGADAIADEVIRISDTPIDTYIKKTGKDGIEITKKDAIEHRRLQVDTRLKLLAKWCPKKYGEKLEVEQSGAVDVRVRIGGTE